MQSQEMLSKQNKKNLSTLKVALNCWTKRRKLIWNVMIAKEKSKCLNIWLMECQISLLFTWSSLDILHRVTWSSWILDLSGNSTLIHLNFPSLSTKGNSINFLLLWSTVVTVNQVTTHAWQKESILSRTKKFGLTSMMIQQILWTIHQKWSMMHTYCCTKRWICPQVLWWYILIWSRGRCDLYLDWFK